MEKQNAGLDGKACSVSTNAVVSNSVRHSFTVPTPESSDSSIPELPWRKTELLAPMD
jgi:hypothetical protein